jgi:ribosome-binding factor A
MTQRKLREQEVQIARYRLLEREVTDPLAASLLHIIIIELEADLQADCVHGSINQRPL